MSAEWKTKKRMYVCTYIVAKTGPGAHLDKILVDGPEKLFELHEWPVVRIVRWVVDEVGHRMVRGRGVEAADGEPEPVDQLFL